MSDPYRNATGPSLTRHVTSTYKLEIREVKVEKDGDERFIELRCAGSFSEVPRAYVMLTIPYSPQALADLGESIGRTLSITVTDTD